MELFLLALWAITPAFFWAGGLLVSVPIIIHLLNRRRFKIVSWAAMDYLLQALRKNRRRIKFEQWLLLATRCALLVLLGLALARPMGCSDSSLASLAGQKSGLHIFVIDNSYSMAYEAERPGARTHLDQAKILAKQQIEKLAGGSESVAIILAAKLAARSGPTTAPTTSQALAEQSGRMILLRPSFDLKSAQEAVDRIEQSYGATDIPAALASAIQIAREEKRQPAKFLYILTDFTKSAWDEPSQQQVLKETGLELRNVFEDHIRINDLGRPGQFNYAVTDLRADSGLVTNTFPVTFLATVRGFGQGGESVIQWKWDDRVVDGGGKLKPSAETEPLKNANITNLIGPEGGEHVLSVSMLDDEKLKVDNTRYRVVKVASAMKVLIVEGDRGNSGTFLDINLAPKKERDAMGNVRSSTYIIPERISDDELPNKLLNEYSAVILAGAGAVTPAQADQIEKFVRGGGTLMIFMGDKVSVDAYNSIFLPRGLVPGKLIGRKTMNAEGKGYTFDFNPNGKLHPALNVFKNQEGTGLDKAAIYSYIQIEPSPARYPEIVLNYVPEKPNTPSDPAILIHNLDRGKVVTVTTTASGEWNTLPQRPYAWIPLIQELLQNSVDVGDKWMNLMVGQSVQLPVGLKLTANPTLQDSARKQVPIEPIIENGQTVFRSRPLDKPGLYELNIGRKVPIAVNVPPEEADLRLVGPAAVTKALGGIDAQLFGDTVPASQLAREDAADWGWALMWAVLVLAGVECYMAMRFGHYRRSAATTVTAAAA
jgi:hypothetical protein